MKYVYYTFNILVQLLALLFPAKGQSSNAESEKLVVITWHVSTEPGEEFSVRITGETRNITDIFGESHSYTEFLGIRFAQSPVKNLRFQRPTLHRPIGDFKANQEPPPCPQKNNGGKIIGDEDCLYLNIYAPQDDKPTKLAKPATKFPVLVWFHGESLEKSGAGIFSLFSSGSMVDLDPEIFVKNRVLVVTPQYRLGSLGFATTTNEDLNGNIGLFDQVLALEWVQRFISDFGGDPTQVTVMGQGSSAISLGLLASSDLAKGLFHRMILMGGSALSPIAIDPTPKATFAEIALQNACPAFPTLRFVRCLQRKSFEDLINADAELISGKHIGKARIPHPVIQRDPDDRFLPPILNRFPLNSFTSGDFEHVPLIIGVNSAEMSGFLPSLAGKPLKEIPFTIFGNPNILNQFIRAVLMRGSSNPDMMADLINFEYFAGLNISDPARKEQVVDIMEEIMSDFLFHMPALAMAKLWSRFAPVYFYAFDYVPSSNPEVDSVPSKSQLGNRKGGNNLQASHGSDLRFLMEGYDGSAKDREVSNIFVDFWISFIHKGSPLHSGLDWPQFREDSLKYLQLGDQVQILSGFRARKDNLWNNLVKKISSSTCSGRGFRGNYQSKLIRESNQLPVSPYTSNSDKSTSVVIEDREIGLDIINAGFG